MADVKLSTTSSIVDYLASVKKPTDFNSRAALYKSSGLEDRLGAYTGSATQNSAFLKQLQTPSQTGEVKPPVTPPAPPKNIGSFSIFGGSGLPGGLTLPTATQTSTPPVVPPKATNTPATTAMNNVPAPMAPPIPASNQATGASQAMDYALKTGANAAASFAPPTPISPTDVVATASGTTTQQAPTMTAKDAGISNPSEAELADIYFNSPEFRAAKEKYDLAGMSAMSAAQSAKEDLEAKYANDRAAVETALGRAGLFMSGIRSTQVAALAQSLAMQNNQVDRQTAQKLLESDASFKRDILAGITDVVKAAKDGNKQAIDQLNKAGLAVVGDKLVPTLESQRADIAQQQFELSQARLDLDAAKFEYAQAKGDAQLAQAQQRIDIALSKLQTPSSGSLLSISDAKSLGLPVALVGTSESDIISSLGSNGIPNWFRNMPHTPNANDATTKAAILTEDGMQAEWDKFRQGYTAASGMSGRSI